jgi:hypothetical protein
MREIPFGGDNPMAGVIAVKLRLSSLVFFRVIFGRTMLNNVAIDIAERLELPPCLAVGAGRPKRYNIQVAA